MEEADKPVWVWTPESTEPMQAGIFSLKSGARMAGVFSYSKEYIEANDAFALDPVHLPFSSRLTARSRHKDGLFGCLRDACPEGYGHSAQEAGSALQTMARIVADGWKQSMRAAGLETAFLDDYQARTFLWAETIAENESLVAAAVQEASAPRRQRRLKPSRTALAPRSRKAV